MFLVSERPTVIPGICFICEMSNDGSYIDTERSFQPNGPTKLNGRKFVCSACATQMANILGFLSPEQAQLLKDEVESVKAEGEAIAAEADLAKAVEAAIAALKPKKAPAKKADKAE